LDTLSLDGTWQLGHSDGERGRPAYALDPKHAADRYFPAQVPGCVHLDLLKVGLIDEPTLGLNSLRARWVEECIWTYRREFIVPAEALGRPAWLVFGQLDLDAKIYLNGKLLATHHNAFLPCRIALGDQLRSGPNHLVVQIDAGLIGAGDKASVGLGNQNHYAYSRALHKSHWLRKPAFQFGWDWTARLGNVGLSGSVHLEFTAAALRLERVVPLVQVAEDLASAAVTVRVWAENLRLESQTVTLRVRLPELGLEQTHTQALAPGEDRLELKFEARDFALWWPRGHGEARLYRLEVELLAADGSHHASPPIQLGFRHVRMDERPHPESGNYCILTVNHRPIFLKGANWVPADMLLARITDQTNDTLIDRALEANFNFLRVWGGGLYERDAFYARCDREGLLVWQDFAYACAKYPLQDEALFLSAKAEARHHIRRLASHPSLVVWCGNNEMECGNWHWGYDRGIIFPDYAFFHHVLPRLLQEEDPTRVYRASSPLSPGGQSPARDDMGDQHNWKVSLEHGDYRAWRDMACRMMTEAGYLGPASLPTLRDCLPAGASPEVTRFAWRHHDNSVDSWHLPSLPDQSFEEHTGHAVADLSLEAFAYLGGVLHGEALGVFIDNFRWRQFDASAACFWMFNDCWPTTRSWTIVDYGLRRTPAFWAVRRGFAPLRVILSSHPDGVRIYGVNEGATPFVGELECGAFSTQGNSSRSGRRLAVTLAPNVSTLIATQPTLGEDEARAWIPFAQLRATPTAAPLARQRLLLPRLRELSLVSRPQITVELHDGKAIFTSPVFVLAVCLDLDGETPWADNFFDLYPNEPYAIAWPSSTPPRILHHANSWLANAWATLNLSAK
jgi:beta-mannosidase